MASELYCVIDEAHEALRVCLARYIMESPDTHTVGRALIKCCDP